MIEKKAGTRFGYIIWGMHMGVWFQEYFLKGHCFLVSLEFSQNKGVIQCHLP